MDPLIKSQLLYQLSYWCVEPFIIKNAARRSSGRSQMPSAGCRCIFWQITTPPEFTLERV
jgi:hypothetical protein